MSRIAVYAGSFDPPTKGHLWMMRQGALLFDELVVALAVNADKPGYLTMEQRRDVLEELLVELPGNVRLAVVEYGFLIDFAQEAQATFLLRGLRNTTDFEYEKTIARMNAQMEQRIQSVFLMAPSEFEQVSSSIVRGFVGFPGWERWAEACVPPAVCELLKRVKTSA